VPDAVVIGAGHNGLVAANLLADAGWSVTVLEATGVAGGAVRTAELTLPGFRHDVFSAYYPLAVASPVMRSLGLGQHGLVWRHAPAVLAHPLPDGRCALLSRDLEVTAGSLDAFAPGDGDAWRSMIAGWDRIGDAVLAAITQPFPPLRPLGRLAARLGPLGLMRFARAALQPVRRTGEELFEGAGAALLLAGSALHADLAPEGAASGLYGWLLCCLGQRFGFPVPEGGAGSLAAALVRRLQSAGGELLLGVAASEVIVRNRRAVAVRTARGDEIAARRAVLGAVAAPLLFGELVRPDHLPASFLDDLRRFQWDMATVKVDWALSGAVPWSAPEARRAGTVHVADDLANLSEFAAHIATGALPARPFLLVGQQSSADPTRSPAGTETAWAYTHVPRQPSVDARAELEVRGPREPWLSGFVERIEARIEALAPGFRDLVLARHVLSPSGIEREEPSLVGGAINGGTAQLHQQLFFRPLPGTGRPETPVARLYLASSSAHPGGGVHGAAGANAARAALLPAARLRAGVAGRGAERLWNARLP
jgi:phytoene dehydrogenase-like protein